MSYNKEKIKKFYEYTLEDYNRSLIIEDIAKVNLVEKTDGKFIQIGIRPLIDENIFISPSFSEYLPGAGRMVAGGEVDFLIKSILDKNEIEKIKFKEDINEFPKYIFDLNNAIILLSTKFYVEVFTKLMNRIDYEEKYPRLDRRYRIIPVSEKVLGGKIMIIDKNAIIWDKEIFDNKITGKKEKIDINIKSAPGGKVDITIRSVNKIKHIDSELIKILEIEDGKKN
ncbi:hypothetical protein BMS3Abin17_01072 [archaeon BMS3Abin17]|nr:hypothetical protein BMS3Abin17_01072 [archaeon BMS3Abin17]HDZ61274.1 hypothetical protein [Candidatus Pacearchaeota archaeon]